MVPRRHRNKGADTLGTRVSIGRGEGPPGSPPRDIAVPSPVWKGAPQRNTLPRGRWPCPLQFLISGLRLEGGRSSGCLPPRRYPHPSQGRVAGSPVGLYGARVSADPGFARHPRMWGGNCPARACSFSLARVVARRILVPATRPREPMAFWAPAGVRRAIARLPANLQLSPVGQRGWGYTSAQAGGKRGNWELNPHHGSQSTPVPAGKKGRSRNRTRSGSEIFV